MTAPSAAPPRDLASTVLDLTAATRSWPDRHLESEVWAWDEYEEVRYAHLHTVMTLRALAARIRVTREQHGPAMTLAQHALADAHGAFRSLHALLAAVPDDLFDNAPAPMEYPLRTVLSHINETETYFRLTIERALAVQGGGEPTQDEIEAAMADVAKALNEGSPAEAWDAYARTHAGVIESFAGITDTQGERLAAMWESTPYTVQWRLWRFGAHLREHTIQVQKTLAWLGVQPTEAGLHAQQIYAALGEVEGAQIGARGMGADAAARIAEELAARYEPLMAAYADIDRFADAVIAGDIEAVRSLLAARPALARTRIDEKETALLHALYRQKSEIVDALLGAKVRMGLHESAAMGNTERLELILRWYPHLLNAQGRDGFTPLQLACYFARPDAVRLLLAKGADPNIVSSNAQALAAIHAAAAGRSTEIVHMLVEAGADVTLRQAGGFTPLRAAQENGDAEIEALLRGAGAVE